jgi:hypothetical protein
MKHYLGGPDSNTKIYAPVSGTVLGASIGDDIKGGVINIMSDQYPAFVFTVMHPVLDKAYKMGDHLTEGDLIGHHVGTSTSSDIIVNVYDGTNTPKTSGSGPDGRLISYFQTLTDSAFKVFRDRGISSPSALIITKAERDAVPAHCTGGYFDSNVSASNVIPTWTDPLPLTVSF